MLSEGVVGALTSAHAALRPGGIVLDLQPEPGDPPVEVIRGGEVVGSPQDESWCAEQIARAAEAVDELVTGGWFAVERTRRYEWRQHAATVEEWASYRASKGMTPLDDQLLRRLGELIAGGADEIVKRERCVATVMRRLDR